MPLSTLAALTAGDPRPAGAPSPSARAAGPATAVFRSSGGTAEGSLDRDPRPLPWLLGSVGAVAVVALGGWLLVLEPQSADTDALRAQTVQSAADEALLTSKVAQLKAQFSDLPQYQADLARVRAQIPTDPQLAELVRTLRDAAATTGVILTSVVPSAPVAATATASTAATGDATAPVDGATAVPEVTAAASTATGSAAVTDPVTGLVEVPLTLTATGSYAAVEAFLAAVQQQQRLVLLTSVALAPGSSADGASVLTLTASGSVFALPVTAAEVAAASAAAPAPGTTGPSASSTASPTALPTSVPTASPSAVVVATR